MEYFVDEHVYWVDCANDFEAIGRLRKHVMVVENV